MEIKQMLLTPNKYSRPQTPLEEVRAVAVHYVGNSGTSAEANRNYFENLKSGANNVYASSHYIVGLRGEIIQCIPENEMSYCTNQANGYTVSIEFCHPDSTGRPNGDTYRSLAALSADICRRHKLRPLEDIIRHHDVTGKMCPLWFVNNPTQWDNFKKDVLIELKEDEKKREKRMVRYDTVNELPKWAKEAVQKLVDRGWLSGTGGGLDLSEDMIRLIVVNDRGGLYK